MEEFFLLQKPAVSDSGTTGFCLEGNSESCNGDVRSQTCAMEGALAPRTSRQERRGVLEDLLCIVGRVVLGEFFRYAVQLLLNISLIHCAVGSRLSEDVGHSLGIIC